MSKLQGVGKNGELNSTAGDYPHLLFAIVLALLGGARVLVSGSVYPWTTFLLAGLTALLLLPLFLTFAFRLLALPSWFWFGLLLYFLAGLLSVFFSVHPAASLRALTFHLGDLLLFFAALLLGRKALRPLALALLTAGALSALFALRQRLGGFAATLQSEAVTEFARNVISEGRVFGLTFSPDMMAGMIAGLLPVVFGLGWSVAGKREDFFATRPTVKILLLVLLALLLALFALILFFTRSLGGWLAAGVGVFSFWFLLFPGQSKKPKRWRSLLLAGAIAVFLAGAGLLLFIRGGHILDLKNPDNPLFRRLDNWTTALRVVREFPLTGAGLGQYGLAMLKHRSLTGNEAKHVHNAPLEILSETGPLGLVGFLVVVMGLLLPAWRLARERKNVGEAPLSPDPDRPLLASFLASGLAILFHSLLDFDWAVPEVSIFFWLGLAVGYLREPEEIREQANSVPVLLSHPLVKVVVSVVWLLVAGAEFYQMEGERRHAVAIEKAREGKWEEAKLQAERALSWDDSRDDIYELWAHARLRLAPKEERARKEAVAALEKAIRINPRYPFYYRDLGLIWLRSEPARTGQALEKAVALYPNHLELNLHLGRWLREQGKTEAAKKVFEHAAKCSVMNGDALLELGLLAAEEGRTQEAAELLRRSALTYPPREYRVLAYLHFLLQQGQKNEAREFGQKWLENHPQDTGVKDFLLKL